MTVPVVEGWTFDLVEEQMLEAWGYLMRLPDRERGWLASCARSSMPTVVRSVREGDYFEDAPGRPGLRANQVDLVDRALTGTAAWIMWVVERDRSLVAVVLQAKSARLVGGFTWGLVASWYGWGGHSDALRKRYSRAVGRIAAKLNDLPDTHFGVSARAKPQICVTGQCQARNNSGLK